MDETTEPIQIETSEDYLIKLTVDDKSGLGEPLKKALTYCLKELLKVNGVEETKIEENNNTICIYKSIEVPGLFKEDKDPAPFPLKIKLEYESISTLKMGQPAGKDDVKVPQNTNSCFNCNGDHNLRDCTIPRNNKKIQKARLSITKRNERYHDVLDQKFGTITPGKLSRDLQRALGMNHRSVPMHIYRMRQFGYPLAWLKEAEVVASTLQIVENGDMKSKKQSKKKLVYDSSKIHDYPGFNVPLNNDQNDEHYRYNAPPMLPMHEKKVFIESLNSKVLANQESEPGEESDVDMQVESDDESSKSPTMRELRETQAKLLDQLNSQEDGEEGAEKQPIDSPAMNRSNALSVAEGTPIIESVSKIDKLPSGNAFSVGVSDVIHFENLPDSTGKYEQMRGVLAKVRKTLLEKY